MKLKPKLSFAEASGLQVEDDGNGVVEPGRDRLKSQAGAVEREVAWESPEAATAWRSFVRKLVPSAGQRLDELGRILGTSACPRPGTPFAEVEQEIRTLVHQLDIVANDAALPAEDRATARLVLAGFQGLLASNLSMFALSERVSLGQMAFGNLEKVAKGDADNTMAWSSYAEVLATLAGLSGFARRHIEKNIVKASVADRLRQVLGNLMRLSDIRAAATLTAVVEDLERRHALEPRDAPIRDHVKTLRARHATDPEYQRGVAGVAARLAKACE